MTRKTRSDREILRIIRCASTALFFRDPRDNERVAIEVREIRRRARQAERELTGEVKPCETRDGEE